MFSSIIDELYNGNLNIITSKTTREINEQTKKFISQKYLSNEDLIIVNQILTISDILWNNTDKNLLPLSDGVYDILLVLYKNYDPTYKVGATPIYFNQSNEETKDNQETLKKCIRKFNKEETNDFLFIDTLRKEPTLNKYDLLKQSIKKDEKYINKRLVNIKHNYPKLVGTLDKAKFVLCSQAEEKGVLNDANVLVLERDFFAEHIKSGVIDRNTNLMMEVSLKYDGVSVEADVLNQVISARTRGDAINDIAADISPVLYGYKFNHAPLSLWKDELFGMKFEAIMTYQNLYKYNLLKGKNYKNCRTAISGLFSSSDAFKYRDFITLVPLATSLDIDRVTEVEFMNKYYHSGEYFRSTIIEGNYVDCLFQIKRFVEEAEYMRPYMPFMYDGIVVTYLNEDIVERLGRVNAVNKYSMAVKFTTLKCLTTFRGYTYTIGQDGLITPMIHYDPVEFYGTIHDKSSGHSFDRFKKLSLREHDIIEVEYVGDVMPYVTKPDNSHNASNENPLLEFITECPSCHSKLEISKSGKSIYCKNIHCPERNLQRIVNMMKKLNLKDFAEAYLKNINIYKLSDMFNLKEEDINFLGDITAKKFIDNINKLKAEPIYDFNIIGSLGFESIAIQTWKTILKQYTIQELLSMDMEQMKYSLINIKGIGRVTADTICEQLEFFYDDLITISNMNNVITSKGVSFGKQIRFTGFRDKDLVIYLNNLGHDANDNNGITKNTDILLIPEAGHESSKTATAKEYSLKYKPILIVPVQEFKDNMDVYLN